MYVAAQNYLGATNATDEMPMLVQDLVANVVFGFPSMMATCGHRGESQVFDRKGTISYQFLSLTCPPPSVDRCGKGSR